VAQSRSTFTAGVFQPASTLEQIEPPYLIVTESDKAVLADLEEQPFAPIRQLGRPTHSALSTVFCHQAENMSHTGRHLC
jgi:hypothetical protein